MRPFLARHFLCACVLAVGTMTWVTVARAGEPESFTTSDVLAKAFDLALLGNKASPSDPAQTHEFKKAVKVRSADGRAGVQTFCVDNQGRVHGGDRENQAIQIFDSDGKFLRQWAGIGCP